jgi:hypothetical protein
MTSATNIPRHIAIIMDGNGRWAERRGLARTAGHQAGAESVREVVRAARELGVGALTLYSFSTENWGRPVDEVKTLMSLLERYLVEETEELLARMPFRPHEAATRWVIFRDAERLQPAAANKLKADLFVSLHYNGGAKGDASSSGIETYCLTPAGQSSTNKASSRADITAEPGNRFDTFNLLLAWNIQRSLIKATGAEDRGIRRSRFAVLRPLNCPGVLVEGGFVSSRTEGAQIANAAYRQKLAEAIAEGVSNYVGRVRSKQ